MSTATYFFTYLALLFLLGLTFSLSLVDLGNFQTFAAIFIAALKAFLILLFFMHVIQKRFLWSLVVGAILFALSVTALGLSDYLMR